MPTNEEGEFELVLGNRQLLSVFFIMIVLLGVFFVSGILVGRSVGTPAEVASAKRPPSKPVDVAPPTSKGPAAVASSRPPAATGEIVPAPPSQVAVTQPARPDPPESKPEPKAKPEPKVKQESRPEPAKPEPPKPAPAKTEVAKAEPPKREAKADPPPAAGRGNTYLQVSATTEAEAATLVAKLNGRGFAASTTPVPGRDLVRVLVGPYGGDDIADARAKLRAAGFDSIPRRK